jgi:hypothetical protein
MRQPSAPEIEHIEFCIKQSRCVAQRARQHILQAAHQQSDTDCHTHQASEEHHKTKNRNNPLRRANLSSAR